MCLGLCEVEKLVQKEGEWISAISIDAGRWVREVSVVFTLLFVIVIEVEHIRA